MQYLQCIVYPLLCRDNYLMVVLFILHTFSGLGFENFFASTFENHKVRMLYFYFAVYTSMLLALIHLLQCKTWLCTSMVLHYFLLLDQQLTCGIYGCMYLFYLAEWYSNSTHNDINMP